MKAASASAARFGSAAGSTLPAARRGWEIALAARAEAGGSPQDVVRTRHYITSIEVTEEVSQAHGEVFSEIRPASTMVVVAALLDPRWVVEVELDAVLPS